MFFIFQVNYTWRKNAKFALECLHSSQNLNFNNFYVKFKVHQHFRVVETFRLLDFNVVCCWGSLRLLMTIMTRIISDKIITVKRKVDFEFIENFFSPPSANPLTRLGSTKNTIEFHRKKHFQLFIFIFQLKVFSFRIRTKKKANCFVRVLIEALNYLMLINHNAIAISSLIRIRYA